MSRQFHYESTLDIGRCFGNAWLKKIVALIVCLRLATLLAMDKAESAAVDPVQVTVGSGSDVGEEAGAEPSGSVAGAPQGYQ